MLEVLLESRGVRAPRPVVGVAISVAVHVTVLVAMGVSAQRAAEELASRAPQERIDPPVFVVPPNRAVPSRAERLRFVELGGGSADDGTRDGAKKLADQGEFAAPLIAGSESPVDLAEIPTPNSATPDNAFSIVDVDSAAIRDPSSAAPSYPPMMMAKGVEGYATMRFVVDSTGLVDLLTVQLLDATHAEFVQAVHEALPRMKFHPARMGAHSVRQLAEQVFRFEIRHESPAATTPQKP
jgi:TonB family protein